jgi:hypothetical protein
MALRLNKLGIRLTEGYFENSPKLCRTDQTGYRLLVENELRNIAAAAKDLCSDLI